MKKSIVSIFILSFLLFAGCGEEHANGENGRHEEQIVYKGIPETWNFDDDKQGEIAGGFSNQLTGKGGLGKWEVIKDNTVTSTPNVIAQTSQEYFGYHFSMAVNEKEIYGDFELIVKFKGVNPTFATRH